MLSIYDETLLNPAQQEKIKKLTKEAENNPESINQVHQVVEKIRNTAGYSGGADGSQYIPLNNESTPEVPDIPNFSGFGSMPDFEWEGGNYQGNIQEMLNQIRNQTDEGFTYDPQNDVAYQSFKNQMVRMGDRAYQNDLASASSRTGGVASSWSQSVAGQSRNQYLQKATDAIPQFRNQALAEYKAELDSKFSMLDAYQKQYNFEYQEALNEYESKVKSYLDDIDMAQQVYNNEIKQYNQQLEQNLTEIEQAWERTRVRGYVSNQDSAVLGLPAGTLSEDARKRSEELEDYIWKQEEDLKQYKKKLQAEIDAEKQMLQWELNNLPSSGGSGGGVMTAEEQQIFTNSEKKHIQEWTSDFYDNMNELTDIGKEQHTNEPLWNSKPYSERQSIINSEIKQYLRLLEDDYKTSTGTQTLTALSKIKNVINSKYFKEYATNEMRDEANNFRQLYNTSFGIVNMNDTSDPEEQPDHSPITDDGKMTNKGQDMLENPMDYLY